jgi:acetylornithine deacetylase/succinyl-diaminopimelate desuccinylase-like protein
MQSQRENALQYAHQHREQSLELLTEILRIPSISTEPANSPDVRRAAEWIATQLSSLGMKSVQIFPTAQHPIVYGEWLAVKGAPTVLIYGHCDVQPTDPLELWKTGPFEPSVRGEDLFGRGAADMKGQLLAAMQAVRALIATGGLPVNIKWLIEGEEEVGSPNLAPFIANHKELLACDFALNPDAGIIGPDAPAITYALRGLAFFELHVHGPAGDLHSGVYGGVVHNPANALAELIAGMHDANGRITLPGFYDKVRPLSKEERDELARLPTDEKHFLAQTGSPALYGEAGYTPGERVSARPTLDVNGMLSGFTGSGAKTVIPAHAMAKISLRLVPDQDPVEVTRQFRSYLEANAPQDIRWELIEMHGAPASISSRENIGVCAMAMAMESVWGMKPFFKREGGSIPVVLQMQRLLGIESVIAGFGLPDDNVHAPNEKLHLPTWYKGIETLIHFFLNLK